jgi:preprotein translocase subunit SecE
VAKAQAVKEPNIVVRYLRETRLELGKVSWPTRQEAINLTIIVVAVTVGMAIFLGSLDFVFAKLFELIVGA